MSMFIGEALTGDGNEIGYLEGAMLSGARVGRAL